MLAENKLKIFNELVSSLSQDELIWVNGFLNGLLRKAEPVVVHTTIAPVVNRITIAYGTETGNSKKIATDFAVKAKKNGIAVKLVSLDQYRLTDLPKEEYFFTIVSTHGDGEPPVAAKKFHEHIHHIGFKVEKLKYSVLALGDTSYPLFCKTGEEIDEQLNHLGGVRINPLIKCDVEFETEAQAWVDSVLTVLLKSGQEGAPKTAVVAAPAGMKKPAAKKTYAGTILSNINLNDIGSNKETYHIEFDAADVEYEPGDSVGIVPVNRQATVDAIISIAGADRMQKMVFKEEAYTFEDLLRSKVNLQQLTSSVVKKYASITGHTIADGKYDLLYLLQQYPLQSAEQFPEVLSQLSAIAPRLYTIASSPTAHPGELHVTVEKDHFHLNDSIQFGLCSEYLGQLPIGSEVNFFVQKNKHYRLPADDKAVIMISPGTGIAASRSFLAERDAKGATGKNWLFFGEENFTTDFLYQSEIQNWFDTGVLRKVNVAFSHDQQERLYVHHKLQQNAVELYHWIESGAYVYVCGQKAPMSVDVENTLVQIIQEQGGKTGEEAKLYFDQLKEQGRYSKDVY